MFITNIPKSIYHLFITKYNLSNIEIINVMIGYKNYEHIAFELNMSRSAYWRLESGANFELKTLIRICKLFKITLAEFFEGIAFPKKG